MTRDDGVFVDSSVLIAAAISGTGHARDLLLLGLDRRVRLWSITLVFDETERNLLRKAPAAVPALITLRQALMMEMSEPPATLVEQCVSLVHAKDAPILAGAVAAGVRWLATYDRRHLLSQRDAVLESVGVVIATPDEILLALNV